MMSNSSTHPPTRTFTVPYQPTLWQAILIGAASSTMALAIIIGNFLVICIFSRNKSLQVPKNFYIVSLAIADLLVGIVPVNIYTGNLISGKWPFGGKVCSVWLSLDHILFTISNMSVLAIACERFTSVFRPIYHRIHFTAYFVKRSIVATWIVSIFVWAPPIIIYPRVNKIKFDPYRCKVIFYQHDIPLTVFVVIFSYVLPVAVLASLYTAVSTKLFRLRRNSMRSTEIQRHTNSTIESYYQSSNTTNENSCAPSQMLEHSSRFASNAEDDSAKQNNKQSNTLRKRCDSHHKRKSEKRALTHLFMIAVAFVLSWLPYHVTVLVEAVTDYVFPDNLWSFCYIIGRLNSFLNPICYGYGNKKFKKGFKKLFLHGSDTILRSQRCNAKVHK